ncbi:MAG: hypothetical protein AABY22_07300 [Nanoarchaeota archaeon]
MIPDVSICILDFKKKEESLLLLNSIKKYVSISHEVIFCSNSIEDYVFDFCRNGLIDKLIVNKSNLGGGYGTIMAFNVSFSKWVLWIENDNEIICEFNNNVLNQFVNLLNNGYKWVDLTGEISGNNIPSGRCFFVEREFYNGIKKCGNDNIFHGPGIYSDGPYLEEYIQNYFRDNNLKVAHIRNFIKDNGYESIRENPDGSRYIHFPDTKQLKVLIYPTQRFTYPKWSEKEWREVLKTKHWDDWKIPENEAAFSFRCFNH